MFDKLEFAETAEQLYQDRFKNQLEISSSGSFVAIDPVTARYFLGETLSEAVENARREVPNGLFHVIRVGHASAIHIG